MKRIKPYVFALMLVMAVICMTACGTTKDSDGTSADTKSKATTTQTSAATTESSTMDETTKADEVGNETETGVINDVVDDVEKGVDNITGESNGKPTSENSTTSQ